MPVTRGSRAGTLEMGVFDASGRCLEDTLLRRTHPNGRVARVGVPAVPGGDRPRDAGKAIYMGVLTRHFGQFVLEGLARAWCARRNPELPIVWACLEGVSSLRSWQEEILTLIGIGNAGIFVTRPARFGELLIPDIGYECQHFFHREHAAALASIDHRPVRDRKLWLSRSKLHRLQNRAIPAVERRLSDLGWQIVFPETLSIGEQMQHMASAERIAGEQGSALHNIIFLRDCRGLRLDMFLRDPSLPKGVHNRNYDTIAARKGVRQVNHLVGSERIVRREGPNIEKTASSIDAYVQCLEMPEEMMEPAPAVGKPRTKGRISADRMNRLAAICSARRYLEVGVASGGTFLKVEIEVRHGVDPEFRFDTTKVETDRIRLFPTTSDEYFSRIVPSSQKYDLIFLDGLHTFEQTFRDFLATLSHAHDDTIWVIDDVFPNDVFSTLRSPQETARYRKLHNVESSAWHGDVFKCVFAINDFLPNVSFRTIRRSRAGNAQTIVVNRPRRDFAPVFNDLERISRMDYFAFRRHRGLLRLEEEEEVFAWVRQQLSSG